MGRALGGQWHGEHSLAGCWGGAGRALEGQWHGDHSLVGCWGGAGQGLGDGAGTGGQWHGEHSLLGCWGGAGQGGHWGGSGMESTVWQDVGVGQGRHCLGDGARTGGEGADPDSIEVVAGRVLALSIPASPDQIRHLAEEIKERVRSLANVDAILEETAGNVRRAEQLLQDARRARSRAESVKNGAEVGRRALEDARRAQSAAESAIRSASNDIRHTEGTLSTVSRGGLSQTASTERQLQGAMEHVGQLDSQLGALKMRRANNSLVATRAKDVASATHAQAGEVKQVSGGKGEETQLGSQARSALQARHRAERLRDEAKALLQDAQGKLQRLTALEGSYQENERVLEEKAAQLDGLEAKVKGIVGAINQQIQIYNTCQ
uniref:Laminin subunit beta-2 n=1 Tax=Gopherus evgoodei TaxID=1825980 RepID=A0A8C4Y2B5_9SAUR